MGLGLHLQSGGPVDPGAAAAFPASLDGVKLLRLVGAGRAEAAVAHGDEPGAAHEAGSVRPRPGSLDSPTPPGVRTAAGRPGRRGLTRPPSCRAAPAGRVRYPSSGVGPARSPRPRPRSRPRADPHLPRPRPARTHRTSSTDDVLHLGRFRHRLVPPWHLGALAGAGGLRSTAEDVLAFVEAPAAGSWLEGCCGDVRPWEFCQRVPSLLGRVATR